MPTLNRRLEALNCGRLGAPQSKIYPIGIALATTCLTFDAFKAKRAVLSGSPNNLDALGLFCRATYGARRTFRADLVCCSRPQTEARIWVDVAASVKAGSGAGLT